MSQGSTTPPLSPNAAQEAGGKLDSIEKTTRNDVVDLLQAVLIELRITNQLLADEYRVNDDLNVLRAEPAYGNY